jgi:single-stranded DNA-binding protein
MVSLTFTGVVGRDPDVRTTENRNPLATFPVDVKEEPHLPPTRILVVAIGKQAAYAQEAIKQGSMVMVGGWFYVQKNAKGIECLEVRAKHLRALIV